MKSNIVIGTIFFTMIAVPGAYAATESVGSTSVPTPETTSTPAPTPTAVPGVTPSPSPTPTPTPNVDTLPPPSQELVQQNPWKNVSSIPVGQVPSGQDEPETWAVVDENGKTLNTIVCDRDYCGSGWIPTKYDGFTPVEFARVVLQGARDPETGNSNGGHWGQHNFANNTWTVENHRQETILMPIEYNEKPSCILNCKPKEDPRDTLSAPPGYEEIWENIFGPYQPPETRFNIEERKITVKPEVIKNNVVINKKLSGKILKNQAIIIATKENKKKIWTKQVTNQIIKFKIPRKYLLWNISIRYTIG